MSQRLGTHEFLAIPDEEQMLLGLLIGSGDNVVL
jgi:hypothetical protein